METRLEDSHMGREGVNNKSVFESREDGIDTVTNHQDKR